jgi:hypothetical protein
MAVFLPGGSSAVIPAHENLTAPLVAQVAARGSQASWEDHARRLAASPAYAGRWDVIDVPDGISAAQALHLARYRASVDLLSQPRLRRPELGQWLRVRVQRELDGLVYRVPLRD